MSVIVNSVMSRCEAERDAISKQWVATVAKSLRGRMTEAETSSELEPILRELLSATKANPLTFTLPAYDELRALLSVYSRTRARHGFTPSETASAIFALREVITTIVPDAKVADIAAFMTFIDGLGLMTFEAFVQARETVILNQTEQLLELSTPVVKLWEGIVALPLVGTLDSARTQVVMEALLQTLLSTGSAHAIIDITGVPAVDTEVAQHLLKTVFAARLMGADCVISGIRPQIAQTIVALGVEFGDIVTKATLADALNHRRGTVTWPVVSR